VRREISHEDDAERGRPEGFLERLQRDVAIAKILQADAHGLRTCVVVAVRHRSTVFRDSSKRGGWCFSPRFYYYYEVWVEKDDELGEGYRRVNTQ
jgi:hypothetical protein